MSEEMAQWQLAELASGFGGLLGLPLDLSWDGHGVRLGTEGDGLYVHEPYDRHGRLAISGWYPACRYSFRGEDRRPITVRADRGGPVIAAEVRTRLLPGYRATVEKIRAYNEQEAAEDQERARLAGLIRGLFPEHVSSMPSHCQSAGCSQITLHMPGLRGGWIKFSNDGREVEIDRLRVPAPVALRMLETVALMTRFDPPNQEDR